MIRFVMLCLTVVRLGQVMGSKRPANELTEALKGRIIYLPVDVQANADVQQDKLLNIDSFVILVKGQPTYDKNVWTALIDLRKIHKALIWLKENNMVYRNIKAYTLEELQETLESRLLEKEKGQEQTYEIPEGAILEKLKNDAKSHLVEHFSLHSLDSSVL